jgi:hypothetical protein
MGTPGNAVPETAIVYRAAALASWVKRGRLTFKAFRDEGLSVGLTPQLAVAGLSTNEGVAAIAISQITSLNRGLTVNEVVEEPAKTEIFGLPPHDADPDLVLTIASDLARIAGPVTPLNEPSAGAPVSDDL